MPVPGKAGHPGINRPAPQTLSVPGWSLTEQNGEALIVLKHSSINLADDRVWPLALGSDIIDEYKEQWPVSYKKYFLLHLAQVPLHLEICSDVYKQLWHLSLYFEILLLYIPLPNSEECLLRAGTVPSSPVWTAQGRREGLINNCWMDWIQLRKQCGR